MDQRLLNTIALNVIESNRAEVFAELRELFDRDVQRRKDKISGAAVHYIHNASLFDCLIWLNAMFSMEDSSENAWKEYLCFSDTLRPKFHEIVEALKDFQPLGKCQSDGIKNKDSKARKMPKA